jgi:hypothetical protein
MLDIIDAYANNRLSNSEDEKLVDFLYDRGWRNPNFLQRVLYFAAHHRTERIRELYISGYRFPTGEWAAVVAARNGNLEAIKLLSSYGISVIGMNYKALGSAVESGRLNVVQWYTQTGRCQHVHYFVGILRSAYLGHLHILNFFLEVEKFNESELREALRSSGTSAVAKRLIGVGASSELEFISDTLVLESLEGAGLPLDAETAYLHAIETDNIPKAQYLAPRVREHYLGRSSPYMIRALLKWADPNKDSGYALSEAAFLNRFETVKELIKHTDPQYYDVAYFASQNGNIRELLLNAMSSRPESFDEDCCVCILM